MDKWHDLLELDMEFAEKRLIDVGEIKPMATLHCGDTVNVVAMNMSDDRAKEMSLKFVRLLVIAHEAEAVSTLGEMWMRAMFPYDGESEADYMARVNAVRPRDAEDRREVVMVQLYYRDAGGSVRELSNAREILRGADGKPTGLAPPDSDPSDVIFSEGPMTELMTPRKPGPEQVRYAKELLKRHGITGMQL